ncbi:MAG TPA: hypothetical protein VFQ65_09185 [Kofleriaceae bacterium]|nr:hypothetical protein [Kofleriaceae bacterium]
MLAAAASFIACKQGVGDRCQIDEDCAVGVCSKSTGKCTTGGSDTPIDATVQDGKIFQDAKVFMDAKVFLDAP